ncbi:MAG: HNH endonuclease [Acidobacteriia bacterium]|nr:HNH endonuclease [Terriglobia bacterium]
MPYKLTKPCAHPGCSALVDSRYCPEHQSELRKRQDAGRPTASQRGYDSKWQIYTADYLKQHPYCIDPYRKHDIRVPSQVVDHKVPHKGDLRLFWDRRNHQPLCLSCHNYKTATEDGGFGRKS